MKTIEKWANYPELDESLKKELLSMNELEKADAFYTDLTFGTGGIRGVMGPGTNRMNIYTLRRANYGYGKFILSRTKNPNPTVVIAFDSRYNSETFAYDSAKVLASLGIKSYIFKKVTPTPVLSFSIRHLKADGGIVITASHNPPKYNGYKIYDEFGCQLVPDLADKVINEISKAPDYFDIIVKSTEDLKNQGMIREVSEDVYDDYLNHVKKISVKPNLDKTNFKIVFTPLHGTSGYLGERLLKELGYTYFLVKEQMLPNPNFPTVQYPNPEDPKAFTYAIRYGKETSSDICIATDPDGDRVGLAVFHQGEYRLLTGNQTGAILLYYLVNHREYKLPCVVFNTIVTSPLGALIAASHGLEVKSTLTGFKYIGEQAKLIEGTNKLFFFGYEESYGYVVGDFVRDKDSLQALLLCSEVGNYYKQQGKTLVDVLEEIYQKYGYHQDDLVNLTFEGQEGAERIVRIIDYFRNTKLDFLGNDKIVGKEDYLLHEKIENNQISKLDLPKANVLKYYFQDGSWFVIRPSGTEPKMKFYLSIVKDDRSSAEAKAIELKKILLDIIEKVV